MTNTPDGSTAGSIYGFSVRSSMPCRFLREDGDDEVLAIRELGSEPWHEGEPVLEWTPRPLRDFSARLYADGPRFHFWTNREGWYSIDPTEPSIQVTPEGSGVRRESRMWGVPALLCYLRRGRFPLHAAAVEVEGRALVFPAPGRNGKTTTACAFLRAGHRVLSEDLTCIDIAGPPSVLPGPAMLRVRRDVYDRIEIPSAVPVDDDPERVHLALHGTARGGGDPVPIAGVVFLRRSDGPPFLERRTAAASIQDLWAFSMNLPTEEDRKRCFRDVTMLAGSVPVWDLRRGLDIADLDAVVESVIDVCLDGHRAGDPSLT